MLDQKILSSIGFKIISFVWILVLLLGAFSVAQAEYERFKQEQQQLLENLFTTMTLLTTTADCRVTIYNPAGSAVVTDQVMSFNANGWYYYDYSIPVLELRVFLANNHEMWTCGGGGFCEDR